MSVDIFFWELVADVWHQYNEFAYTHTIVSYIHNIRSAQNTILKVITRICSQIKTTL